MIPLSSHDDSSVQAKKSCLRKHEDDSINDGVNNYYYEGKSQTESVATIEETTCTHTESSWCSTSSISSLSLSSSTSVSNDDRERRIVSFGHVEIREYPMILGDNPSPTDGIPITIGWKPQRQGIFTVDQYEKFHLREYCPKYGQVFLLSTANRARL